MSEPRPAHPGRGASPDLVPDPGVQPADDGPVVPAESAEDLYEHAPCGYLSTLPDGTIIKVNATFLAWTGYRREELVGSKQFADLLTPGGRIYHETHYAPLLSMQGSVREIAVDVVRADRSRLPVLVNSILVRTATGDPHVIRTSIFDATDRREYERELVRAREQAERSEARARELAETLQRTLIPPSPPHIEGLDIAAAYRPAGTGDEVGGDFYDAFETGQGDWAVVVGDVCGKGAEAAVVTSLARHTVRAAAMRDPSPAGVLATLNAALLHHSPDRFCTVVCLRVRRVDSGAEITVASGGHALPLRLGHRRAAGPAGRRSDATETVGRSGSLLGVVDDPELHDTLVVLEPGEALFCYTDGLTEGRRGEEFYGEERLEALLVSLTGRAHEDIPRAVVDEIVAFQEGRPRDDMAAVLVGVPPDRANRQPPL